MGFSPLPGLVMSTRCGDIDAEIVLELLSHGYSTDQITDILNNKSGVVGLSGYSSNLAEVISASENGHEDSRLAFDVYAHRLKIYLGAYTWLLNGADAILFTDEIGVKSWQLRERVCSGAENLGVILDQGRNKKAQIDKETCISASNSRTQVWVVPTNEEQVILQEVIVEHMGSR
jgi:acetate kinase